ncbi:RINT-1 family protein-like protein [Delitschia confertaspora ATCC 74209]|uniref:RINT-1 family protein-like protein n=1 Tax=Delitschia confertaspora ATCC 74209 TaxID=1513339 RepID=A0A9P4MS49_9PLEO|nr:RINT-1 family protein-like protein [Delitschia confertaspora ATCC 74209]
MDDELDERQTRVADYLDDKLQTLGDLTGLDALLANIHNQHGLLKQQLQDAQNGLSEAKQASHNHWQSLQERSSKFHAEQADIDRRLQVITESDTTDEATPRFEAILDTLQRLDVANGYLELLQEINVLSDEAQTRLKTSNEAALEPYKQLRSLHTKLIVLQADAEGAAPQLLHHVDLITQTLRGQIFDAFSSDLEKVLKKIGWPTPKATVPGHLQDEWQAAVGKLLELQLPELDGIDYSTGSASQIKLPAVLLPLEVLVEPLEMRFRYHFEGDRPTNRIDRPEYFLSHITTLLTDYSGFVVDFVQPALLHHFRGKGVALNPVYIDATSAFITALLPMLRNKIGSLLPKVASQPQLLSHLMHEVMSFDTTIREEWRYDGGYGVEGWKGLSWEFLVQADWFGRWLQVEKDFALTRYQSIVEAPDFGDLDYESVDPKATKPTKGAIRVNDLLETITDRYRPLTSFSQKLRFVIDIQIAIFDKFHERLQSNLEAYVSMTSTLGRTVQGISKEQQEKLLGLEGLETLCKTYGSADYLEKAMRDWSDDVFFLDIWDELHHRARQASNIGSMTVDEVAGRTSNAVGSDAEGGGLFDETAGWYSRLRIRSEKIITDTINNNVREALRPYRNINPWTTLSGPSVSAAATPSPTAELDAVVTYLTNTLGFLSRTLALAPLRRISRAVVNTIATIFWDLVISRHRFSTAGAAQLSADLAAVCRVVDASVGPGVAEVGLRRCLEGAKLLGLPVKGYKSRMENSADEGNEEEWGAWDAEGGEESVKGEQNEQWPCTPGELGLWEVEKRIFDSNESAREVLEELNLDSLSETEARNVLRRRIELGS